MSIPKRLILYRVSRYQKDYPMNIKYGCYSDTMSLSTERKSIQGKHTRKMVRNLDLNIIGPLNGHGIVRILNYFPKSNGITRCYIYSHFSSKKEKRTKDLVIKVIQRIFKTWKYLQQVNMDSFHSLQKNFGTFKNLLLQRSLLFLILNPLQYSEESMDLKPFLKLCQITERRNCWPNFVSLGIDFGWTSNYNPGAHDRLRSIKNLLEFLENFKSCKTLYQCSKFRLRFPYSGQLEASEPKLKKKIFQLQVLPHMTHLDTDEMKYFPQQGLNEFHDLENVRKIYFYPFDSFFENFDMSVFNDIPNLEKVYLGIYNEQSIASYKSTLGKVQSLTNLRSLSISFSENPEIINQLGVDLCQVFSSLSELRCLSLKLHDRPLAGSFRIMKCPWLEDAFKILGDKKKLEKLTLEWERLCFESSRRTFNAICRCIGELHQLSSLDLRLGSGGSIQDKDIRTLAKSIKKLKKMKKFSIEFLKDSGFKSSTFVFLMRRIMKSFPILSYLFLYFLPLKITTECYHAIYELVHKMKGLNYLDIFMKGELEEGLDLKLIRNEALKRMPGSIDYSSK